MKNSKIKIRNKILNKIAFEATTPLTPKITDIIPTTEDVSTELPPINLAPAPIEPATSLPTTPTPVSPPAVTPAVKPEVMPIEPPTLDMKPVPGPSDAGIEEGITQEQHLKNIEEIFSTISNTLDQTLPNMLDEDLDAQLKMVEQNAINEADSYYNGSKLEALSKAIKLPN